VSHKLGQGDGGKPGPGGYVQSYFGLFWFQSLQKSREVRTMGVALALGVVSCVLAEELLY